MTSFFAQTAEPEIGLAELDPSLDARHEQWLREQYLRDLETLDRIERQHDCFFDAMGGLHGGRAEGPIA